MLSFYTKEEHEFSNEEVEFLSMLAGQAAIAIHNSSLYEQTKKQAADLVKSNRVKDEFPSVMSHELRTPLNIVVGYTGMIKDGMLGEVNPEQRLALEKVMNRTHDLLNMIMSILGATQIEAGEVKVETQRFSVDDFFAELRAAYDRPAGKELALFWDCPSGLSVLETDREKLKQILQNLIHNALKFTERGSVTISARMVGECRGASEQKSKGTELQRSKGAEGQGSGGAPLVSSSCAPLQFIEFKVADTGIGIAKEKLPIIFEMFRQADSSETRLHGGVGLGLYLAKKLTEVLGGNIEVETEEGRGSTFTVTIPCKRFPSGMSNQGDKRRRVVRTGQEFIPPRPNASSLWPERG